MTYKDFKEYKEKVEDRKINVFPPSYYAKFVSDESIENIKEKLDKENYANRRQLDWTLGYLAGMKKARKLLKKSSGEGEE